MELTGKFKTEFEAWLKDNGYTPKYFEVLCDGEKEFLLEQFLHSVGLYEETINSSIQKAIEKYNEYYQYI